MISTQSQEKKTSKKKLTKSQLGSGIIVFEQDENLKEKILNLEFAVQLRHAASLEATIEFLNRFPEDILLLNVLLLPNDGYELSQKFHSENLSRCIILYSSLKVTDEEHRRAYQCGAFQIVSIYEGIAELYQAIQEAQLLLQKYSQYTVTKNKASLSTPIRPTKKEQNLLKEIEQLRASEIRYKNYFENASFPIFVLDPKKDIVLEMNEQAERFLGYTRSELKQMGKLPFVSPSTRLRDIVNWGIQLTNTATMRTKSGEFVDVELTAGLIDQSFSKSVNSSFLILYIKDVTEQKRLREQLVQAEKMSLLGRLSAGIAHEIRNPLTAVKINLQEFDLQITEEHPLRDSLALALEGVKQIEQIIENTLEFARPTKPEREKANVNEVLEKSLSFAKIALQKKRIQLRFNFASSLPFVHIDTQQIQQVFLNLLTNSIEASANNGIIEVRTFLEKNFTPLDISTYTLTSESENYLAPEENEYVVVEFKDNGSGIPKEHLEHVFEPFFTTKAKGTGLGLAISKQILELHNAFIAITTNDTGTSFSCYFPILKNGETKTKNSRRR